MTVITWNEATGKRRAAERVAAARRDDSSIMSGSGDVQLNGGRLRARGGILRRRAFLLMVLAESMPLLSTVVGPSPPRSVAAFVQTAHLGSTPPNCGPALPIERGRCRQRIAAAAARPTTTPPPSALLARPPLLRSPTFGLNSTPGEFAPPKPVPASSSASASASARDRTSISSPDGRPRPPVGADADPDITTAAAVMEESQIRRASLPDAPPFYTDADDLRRAYGSNRNGPWGDLDAKASRRLYHALLPRPLMALGDAGVMTERELAPLAFDARRAAKRYARERCALPGRVFAATMEGARSLLRRGEWRTGGPTWQEIWNKYERQLVNELLSEGVSYDVDELTRLICWRILERSCCTNPTVDKIFLGSSYARRRKGVRRGEEGGEGLIRYKVLQDDTKLDRREQPGRILPDLLYSTFEMQHLMNHSYQQ